MIRRIYRHPDDGVDGAQVLVTYNAATDEMLVGVRPHESGEWSLPFTLVRAEDDTAEQEAAGPRYAEFFMLLCESCDERSFELPMPFASLAARTEWMAAHSAAMPGHRYKLWNERKPAPAT